MSDVFSYNLVFLLGRCCVDPELTEISDEKSFVKFSMATNELYFGGKKHVEFHSVVLFGEKKREFILNHLKKGMMIAVKGKLRHKTLSSSTGQKKSFTNVVADDVILVDKWSKKGVSDAPF